MIRRLFFFCAREWRASPVTSHQHHQRGALGPDLSGYPRHAKLLHSSVLTMANAHVVRHLQLLQDRVCVEVDVMGQEDASLPRATGRVTYDKTAPKC